MRHSGADEMGAALLRISQRRVPRFPNDPVLRRCAFNRCSILDTAARGEQNNQRRKDPAATSADIRGNCVADGSSIFRP
jgi:hypothetical protein